VSEPIIADSAYRHGFNDNQILHAIRNPVLFGEPEDGLTMLVGAAPDGTPIEVGIVESDDGEQVVVHAMEAREKYLRDR
jgi:hypothetical protein